MEVRVKSAWKRERERERLESEKEFKAFSKNAP
jgi:hypothetical protein